MTIERTLVLLDNRKKRVALVGAQITGATGGFLASSKRYPDVVAFGSTPVEAQQELVKQLTSVICEDSSSE